MPKQEKFFLLYCSYIDPVAALTDEEAGRLFKAILCHVNDMEMPELTGPDKIAFSFMRTQLDASRDRYQARCEANRENGRKGGRPKQKPAGSAGNQDAPEHSNPEKPDETQVNQTVSKKAEKAPKTSAAAVKPGELAKPQKKQFAEFVSMTEAEYEKLVQKHGERAVARMIEILDNYKGSSTKNAKRYTSDYRAILSWVVDRYEEEQAKKPRVAQQAAPSAPDTEEDWVNFYQEGYNK